jgi:hypothetical protein
MAVTLELTQAGSGTNVIHAQPGDTITIAAASVVNNAQIAAAASALTQLTTITGVKFAIDTTGDAS